MHSLELPASWESAANFDLEGARKAALESLELADLGRYYSTTSNYAGAAFATLGTNDPFDITPDDLHAVSLLGVQIGPKGTRALLDPGEPREAVLAALRPVPADVSLAHATGDNLLRASEFHDAIVDAIRIGSSGSGPWVTAAKLSARKRPYLIPVRDNVVGNALGGRATASRSVYWQVVHHLLTDPIVSAAMTEARARIQPDKDGQPRTVRLDHSDLRFLDAAIWMHHARGTKADASDQEGD